MDARMDSKRGGWFSKTEEAVDSASATCKPVQVPAIHTLVTEGGSRRRGAPGPSFRVSDSYTIEEEPGAAAPLRRKAIRRTQGVYIIVRSRSEKQSLPTHGARC